MGRHLGEARTPPGLRVRPRRLRLRASAASGPCATVRLVKGARSGPYLAADSGTPHRTPFSVDPDLAGRALKAHSRTREALCVAVESPAWCRAALSGRPR